MFEGKHFQPQKNSILLQKGNSAIMSFCSNIVKIVDNAEYFKTKSVDEIETGKKKGYKRFASNFYNLMVDGAKIDSIIEEMWSRVWAKKFNKYSPAQGYYEALRQLGCGEDTINELKILRDFRNLCCHSVSLKDSIAQKKDPVKYLLAIKPIARSLYKKTVIAFEEMVKEIPDEDFDELLWNIIQDRNKRKQQFKKESFLELYGLKNDKKFNCHKDKDIILEFLKKKILKQQEGANEVLAYKLCAELIIDIGCILEKEEGRATYNQILLILRSIGEIAKLENRANSWGKTKAFRKLHELFDLVSSDDVNGRKQIKWQNVYLKSITEIYAVMSNMWDKEKNDG